MGFLEVQREKERPEKKEKEEENYAVKYCNICAEKLSAY
jgi:hypothetical protein